ncbi:hypothetical protein DL89DRAFT_265869 [Linderina pennispora]|uniref:SANTA domain-containing protein n=1 Tax=Linderina pennispora TaxID=61395 RepID=A0A1Y1WFK2_9FUNG|nr:uncharacterized protein DL89DRAFT_265869 [Linderina pennispora]ORX72267.1 hypothetical protein DL89DRAFT_265869 [Linderina pennispora]
MRDQGVFRTPYPQHLAQPNTTPSSRQPTARTGGIPRYAPSLGGMSPRPPVFSPYPRRFQPVEYPTSLRPLRLYNAQTPVPHMQMPRSLRPILPMSPRIALPGASTVIELREWFVFIDVYKHTVLVGGLTTKETGETMIRYSSDIRRVFSAQRVLSSKGREYSLAGPISVEGARRRGLPDEIIQEFADGFPVNWRIVVSDYIRVLLASEQGYYGYDAPIDARSPSNGAARQFFMADQSLSPSSGSLSSEFRRLNTEKPTAPIRRAAALLDTNCSSRASSVVSNMHHQNAGVEEQSLMRTNDGEEADTEGSDDDRGSGGVGSGSTMVASPEPGVQRVSTPVPLDPLKLGANSDPDADPDAERGAKDASDDENNFWISINPQQAPAANSDSDAEDNHGHFSDDFVKTPPRRQQATAALHLSQTKAARLTEIGGDSACEEPHIRSPTTRSKTRTPVRSSAQRRSRRTQSTSKPATPRAKKQRLAEEMVTPQKNPSTKSPSGQRSADSSVTRSGRRVRKPQEWWANAQDHLHDDADDNTHEIKYKWGTGVPMIVKKGKRIRLSDYFLNQQEDDRASSD